MASFFLLYPLTENQLSKVTETTLAQLAYELQPTLRTASVGNPLVTFCVSLILYLMFSLSQLSVPHLNSWNPQRSTL